VRDADGHEGGRDLRGQDCPSIAAGLAFVAAVVVDPDSARALDPPPLSVDPPERSAPPAPSNQGTSEARGQRSRLAAGTAFEVAYGLGPDTEVIPRLFLDFELPGGGGLGGLSLRAGVGRGFAQSVKAGPGSASITLTDARLEPCAALWARAPFVVRGCGVMGATWLSGQGDAATTLTTSGATRITFEAGLALRAAWTFHDRISVGLLAGGAVPLARYRFYFTAPDTTVYEVAAWSGFGELSAGVYFW
jgi:hypothetical protein